MFGLALFSNMLFKILFKTLDKKHFSICFLTKHKSPAFTILDSGKGDKT